MEQAFGTNDSPASPHSDSLDLGKLAHGSIKAIVVPNSALRLGQCGLPKRIAFELYKTRLIERLMSRNHVDTIDEAEYAIACQWNEVLDELIELLRGEPVLLFFTSKVARAAVQAFEPQLIEGSAIQIHPTIAQQLEIDFSGQAVFARLPHSPGGRAEAQNVLNSSQSFISQRNGTIDQSIPREAAMGIYYLTLAPADRAKYCDTNAPEPPLMGSIAELEYAMEAGRIGLHDSVTMRLPSWMTVYGSERIQQRSVRTTAGRVMFNQQLPLGWPYYNEKIGASRLTHIIKRRLSQLGRGAAIQLVENLSKLGWDALTRSGLSIGMDDLKIATEKERYCAEARKRLDRFNRLKQKGLLSESELQREALDSWWTALAKTREDIARELDTIEVDSASLRHSFLALGGDYGFTDGISQISGMVGTLNLQYQKPLITASFREGLRATDYFRYRLDPKSRTREKRRRKRQRQSWRLTPKLNDVLRDTYVSMHDCGTTVGFAKTEINDYIIGFTLAERVAARVVGRVSSERIVVPASETIPWEQTLVDRNELITWDSVELLVHAGFHRIEVRSPVACRAPKGVCQLCYGVQPHSGALPPLGERVGSQAALAIGDTATKVGEYRWYASNNPWVVEPRDSDIASEVARGIGRVRFDETKCAVNRAGQTVVLTPELVLSVCNDEGQMMEQVDVPYASVLKVRNNELVQFHQVLAEWTPEVYKLVAEHSGRIRLSHLPIKAHGLGEDENPIMIHRTRGAHTPTLEIIDEHGMTQQSRYLVAGTRLLVSDGSQVSAGDVLAEWRRPKRKADPKLGDGPLPKWVATHSHLESLFNLTVPIGEAAMAEFDGELSVTQAENGVSLKLSSIDGSKCKEYLVPHRKSLFNFYAPNWRKTVSTGELLSHGGPGWQDTLRVRGTKFFVERWMYDMLLIHHMNKLKIAEQHLELALGRMTSLCQITDTGDTTMHPGAIIKRTELERVNSQLSQHGRPAEAKTIATGLFEQSIQSLAVLRE